MTSVLSGKVKAVRASQRLKSHPVCLANEGELSIEMEKVLNSMPNRQQVKADKVLEVNVNHEVFKSLQAAYEQDQAKFDLYTDVLYNQARLIEGLDIVEKIASESQIEEKTEENASDMDVFVTKPVIKNATVDTFGNDYGVPQTVEYFDYQAYMSEILSQYYGTQGNE